MFGSIARVGCPLGRAARVESIGQEEFPEMDEASIPALAVLDRELQRQEEWVPKLTHSCVFLPLKCNDTYIHALIDTGLELNLTSPKAVVQYQLQLTPLPRPARVNFVMAWCIPVWGRAEARYNCVVGCLPQGIINLALVKGFFPFLLKSYNPLG
ncbi:hypothetical protein VP01_4411g1, partial [Puccinia sorghi]